MKYSFEVAFIFGSVSIFSLLCPKVGQSLAVRRHLLSYPSDASELAYKILPALRPVFASPSARLIALR